MCGFACILNGNEGSKWDAPTLINSLRKRGPDTDGQIETEFFSAVHTRLSIIDLDSRSDQPMWDSSKRFCLLFNGEIYNYRELRSELIGMGVEFRTESDTEVLLQVLIRDGKNGLSKLNGCFALCFMDTLEHTALVARDRFGINPLYYANLEGQLICASSFRSVLSAIGDLYPDPHSISDLARFSFIPAPFSFDKRIQKLEPGHCLEVIQGEFKLSKWYTSNSPDADSSLMSLLEESVQARLISDVPVGTFLSGGLDSSLISAIASKFHPGITAFSIGFDTDYLDESKWAKQMANHLEVDHRLHVVKESEMLDDFDEYLDDLDEPFGDSSSLAMWTLSRMAATEVKVCLSGDGADELFGGYNRHRAFWHWNQKSLKSRAAGFIGKRIQTGNRESKGADLKRKLRAFADLQNVDRKDIYLTLSAFATQEQVVPCLGEGHDLPFLVQQNGSTALDEYLLLDQSFVLPNDMLQKVDMMSMAHSLEVRTPFLDHRLVEWVNAQRVDQKYTGSQGKIMLRDAARASVPKEIISRKKSGFEIPVESWLRGPLSSYLASAILEIEETLESVNGEALKSAHSRFQSGESGLASMMWSTMILGQWLKRNYSAM